MKKRLKIIPLKKFLITVMVACILVLGGLIVTSPMLDNSDPITSGEYIVGETGPEWDPFPEVKVDPENTPDKINSEIEGIKNFVNDALDKAEEFMDERQEKVEDKNVPDSKSDSFTIGGMGIGTLFTLYVAYRFIFK